MQLFATPQELIDYSDFAKVQQRAATKLGKDIMKAQLEVYADCGHEFDDTEKYPTGPDGLIAVPEEIKLAVLQLAEYYALVNSDESRVKGIKSETFSKYAYTLGDTNVQKPDISPLILKHIKIAEAAPAGRGTRLRMRRV